MHCIDLCGKSLRPQSFGKLSVGVFVCVNDSSLFLHHYLVILGIFLFFSEAMDVLGPGGCGGFNSCDCCCAPQDLRATRTHTYTYTANTMNQDSRATRQKTNAISYHRVAENWLWLGTLEITDEAYIISRKQSSKSTCAELWTMQLVSVQLYWKCTWPCEEFLNLDLKRLSVLCSDVSALGPSSYLHC